MKALVLATAPFATVMRSVARLQRRSPDAAVVIAVSEVERIRFERADLTTLVVGEQSLQLDEPPVRQAISEQGFDLCVIPMGLPRLLLLFVARLVRSVGGNRFVADLPLLRHLRRWRLVWLVLVGYSLVLALPVVLAVRCGLLADEVLLLAAQLLARVMPRRRRGSTPACGEPGLVCHIIPSLGTGGAQRQLIEYLRHSRIAPSRRCLLVLWEYNDFFVEELRSLDIAWELLVDQGHQGWLGSLLTTAFPFSSTLWMVRRRLRVLRPSTVYSWLFRANVIAVPAARLAGVPRIISSVRNMSEWKTWPEYRRWWMRPVDRLSAAMSTLVVANAQAVADDYAAWTGVDAGRLRVVPNAVDLAGLLARCEGPLPAGFPVSAEVPVVLTMGRLAAEKDQALLLRACARVRDRGIAFSVVIVGHGELEPELRQLSESLALSDRVVFIAKTAQPAVLYRAAGLFVLSSRIEGMPNVVIEAQALGLAVVTTDSGGSAEVVDHGRTGLVVARGDEEALAAAMATLLGDAQLRESMGSRGQRRMADHFDLSHMTAAIDALSTATS